MTLSFVGSVSLGTLLNLSKSHFTHFGISLSLRDNRGFLGSSDGQESACNAGDQGSVSGSGRSPREGNGNTFQYFCLENSIEEPGELQSMGSQIVGHDCATNIHMG